MYGTTRDIVSIPTLQTSHSSVLDGICSMKLDAHSNPQLLSASVHFCSVFDAHFGIDEDSKLGPSVGAFS